MQFLWRKISTIFVLRSSTGDLPISRLWCSGCSRRRNDSSVLRGALVSGKVTLPFFSFGRTTYTLAFGRATWAAMVATMGYWSSQFRSTRLVNNECANMYFNMISINKDAFCFQPICFLNEVSNHVVRIIRLARAAVNSDDKWIITYFSYMAKNWPQTYVRTFSHWYSIIVDKQWDDSWSFNYVFTDFQKAS